MEKVAPRRVVSHESDDEEGEVRFGERIVMILSEWRVYGQNECIMYDFSLLFAPNVTLFHLATFQ